MFVIPERERLLYYAAQIKNMESEPIAAGEYPSLSRLRTYLVSIMLRHNGIGMSAPQAGIFRNYFVMKTDAGSIIDMVNPEVIQMYGHETFGFEASLSIPPHGNGCPVPRLETIIIEHGTSERPDVRETVQLYGMDARVAQHELDYLTGTFFIDRASIKWRKVVLKLYKTWKEKQYAENNSRFRTTDRTGRSLPHLRKPAQGAGYQEPKGS